MADKSRTADDDSEKEKGRLIIELIKDLQGTDVIIDNATLKVIDSLAQAELDRRNKDRKGGDEFNDQ